MTVLEYTKNENKYLLTSYSDSASDTVNFCFPDVLHGTLYVGNTCLKIENGFASSKISTLNDGTYTPILHIGNDSFTCDRIKVEAGVVTPQMCITQIALRLTKEIIAADAKIAELEQKLTELSAAVYGKSIL